MYRIRSKHEKVVRVLNDLNQTDIASSPNSSSSERGKAPPIEFAPISEPDLETSKKRKLKAKQQINRLITRSNNLVEIEDVLYLVVNIVLATAAMKIVRNFRKVLNCTKGKQPEKSNDFDFESLSDNFLNNCRKFNFLRNGDSAQGKYEKNIDERINEISQLIQTAVRTSYSSHIPLENKAKTFAEYFITSSIFLHPNETENLFNVLNHAKSKFTLHPSKFWINFVKKTRSFKPLKNVEEKGRKKEIPRWQQMHDDAATRFSGQTNLLSAQDKMRKKFEISQAKKKEWK
eukprot:g1191.t1